MASPRNQHCDTSIGTLSLPTIKNFTTEYNTGEKRELGMDSRSEGWWWLRVGSTACT